MTTADDGARSARLTGSADRDRMTSAASPRTTQTNRPPRAGATVPTTAGSARPSASGSAATTSLETEPRRVRLTLTRVNPFSVLKIAFLLSVALGIAGVVVTAVLWTLLNGMGVFSQINGALGEIPAAGNKGPVNIYEYVGFGRVLSLSVVFAVADVILLSAMATVGAFLYNICAALVGGLNFTLSDD